MIGSWIGKPASGCGLLGEGSDVHKHRTRIWRQGAPWRQGEIWRQGGSTRKPLAGKLWRLMGGGEGEGDEDENALKSADRLEGGGEERERGKG